MFDKILIANRGEIAVRIISTCKKLGIGTVAVFSEADHRSTYVEQADEAVFIGGARAQESYLNMDRIIDAALSRGCQAIHPGYGFLSESAAFAQRVADAGLTFIGPPAAAIALLGDKMASKALALRAGVPVVPGPLEPVSDPNEAADVADAIGFPVLLKPAAGGGGRGMRVVQARDEFPSALAACREETRKSFGDDRIFVERYLSEPRHIEFQILADEHGTVIHLGERECSIQRRHQKIIEETPSVAVGPELRAEMGRLACTLSREAGYTNAGTVEFILDAERNVYFLEMNTRLQVEHPVTECVTGLDLVEMQLRVAAGERLPLTQDEVEINGWAIEARVCAEDPSRGFFPTTGIITRYAVPKGANIRVDAGIAAGSSITIYYDSLLAKVIAWGSDREEARQTLIRALNGYHIEGLSTNVDFCNAIANHPAFARGELSTGFIEKHFQDGESIIPYDSETLHYMAIAAALVFHTRGRLVVESLKPMRPMVGAMPEEKRSYDYVTRVDTTVLPLRLRGDRETRQWEVDVDGTTYAVETPEFEYYRRRLALKIHGRSHMFRLQYEGDHIKASFRGVVRTFEFYTPKEWRVACFMLRGRTAVQENVLRCPMPGLVTEVCVTVGENVRRGQELLRMESMKMESGVASPRDGRVEKILVQPGQAVETDEELIRFEL